VSYNQHGYKFEASGKSSRIPDEILLQWPDQEIANLVIEYYKIFDETGFPRGGLQQSLDEVTMLREKIGDRKFNKFVEIGVADGGTMWLYTHLFCTIRSKIIGIDIHRRHSATKINDYFKSRKYDLSYIIADCGDVAPHIHDESIDFLHIDGNHDYDSVEYYFNTYYPKVSKGGVILIHDTAACDGSIKYREEVLEPNYNHTLIVGQENMLISGAHESEASIIAPGISMIIKE
jgi:predicted O-methyltransferase YrrM